MSVSIVPKVCGYAAFDPTNVSLTGGAATGLTSLGITQGAIISGTYTPTLTNGSNVAASTAYVCQYARVGSAVTVSGQVDIDPTAAGSADTNLGISLPVASAFTVANQVGGAAACQFPSISASIAGDVANTRANLKFAATDLSNRSWMFNFTYLIV